MVGCFSTLTPRFARKASRDASAPAQASSEKASPSLAPAVCAHSHAHARPQDQNQDEELAQGPFADFFAPPSCCTFAPLHPSLYPPAYSDAANEHVRLALAESKGAEGVGAETGEMSAVMTEVAKSLEETIGRLDKELRELSIKMWENPEIMWKEKKTHDLFVNYLKTKSGWKVTPHAHKLETAFRAEYVHLPRNSSIRASDVRTIGFNSELDALPGIGHACGHNCIAIAGVAASLAVAEALVKHDLPGRVVLLGTPAEEGGGGKINLVEDGAYEGMDACLMVHPAPSSNIGSTLAVVPVVVKYEGHPAHSAAAPWEGINALDAAVLAYSNISALRQQLHPSTRVHGIISGKGWAPNVVPDNSTLTFNIRAPTLQELSQLTPRVQRCFEAAALATGCKLSMEWGAQYADVHNNAGLTSVYRKFMRERYGTEVVLKPFEASTDFGNVTYAVPGLHPEFAIALKNPKTNGNHTVGFADAARTQEAHERTREAALGIAVAGAQVVVEEEFAKSVRKEWEEWKANLPKELQ